MCATDADFFVTTCGLGVEEANDCVALGFSELGEADGDVLGTSFREADLGSDSEEAK